MSELAVKVIAKEEGFRSKPYLCSEGYPTIGYGKKIGKKNAPLDMFDFEMPEHIAALWMQSDIDELIDKMEFRTDIGVALESCNEARQAVLISMAYQMGASGLDGFKKMLNAIEFEDWEEAAEEGMDSRWARQTPDRARRHMEMIKSGVIGSYYT